jgi:hypothetical protein
MVVNTVGPRLIDSDGGCPHTNMLNAMFSWQLVR